MKRKMSKERCPECNKGVMQKTITPYTLHGVNLGKYTVLQCSHCKAKYFDEETVGKIQAEAKKKGVFGLEAKTKFAALGNSYAVRIPRNIFNFLGIRKGEEANITVENKHKIIITI